MSSDVTTKIAGLVPMFSAREAAALLNRSYSWLDQRVRNGDLLRPDGTAIEPLRSQGGYRYFTFEMLEDIVKYCYRQRGYTFKELKSVVRQLVMAAHGDTGEGEIPS
jgi:hypothetical protein